MARFQDIAYSIRNIRGELGIAPKEDCDVRFQGTDEDAEFVSSHWNRLKQLVRLPEKPEFLNGEEPAASSTRKKGL